MALGVGSVVSPKVNLSGFFAPSAAGPMFGVSESAGTPFTITWQDGQRVASIPTTSLDEILATLGGAASTKFLGQRVRITTQTQSGYGLWVCVQVYNRGGVETALLQHASGAFIEALISVLEIVP